MKRYDFIKAKKFIDDAVNLKSASLGMCENWTTHSELIWKDGNYLRTLPDNIDELIIKYYKKRKLGKVLSSAESNGYESILIKGIYGSAYDTPTLELVFKDDSKEMIEVSQGLILP